MAYKFYTDIKAKPISYKSTKRKLSDIIYIIVHASGNKNDTAKNNALYYANGNTQKVGAHLFVDDISVYQSIAPDRIAHAVGGEPWDDCEKTGGGKLYGKCTNSNSISVELCSKNGKPTKETLDNAEILIKGLMKKYNIPSSRVVMHFDVNGKHCPYWDGWWNKEHHEWYKFKTRFQNK